MASLRELRKHLKSIHTTEQLAGAMKTVSAAKFSRIGGVLEGYRPYADACREMAERFGSSMAEVLPCTDPDAPDAYVVIAGNRGLCGGYNILLLEYADEILSKAERPYKLTVCGKMAAAHYGGRADEVFSCPDVPDYGACAALCERLRTAYTAGEISSVSLIYQKFENMLTQVPSVYRLLPLSDGSASTLPDDGTLYVPDRGTVLKSACINCMNASLYAVILEACAGAQAATLMAMRSAYDNARESSAKLETVISRKRQGEVTASVLETAVDVRETR